MSDPIKLSKPIQAHGETLTQLTFREPTGRDMRECGLPMRVSVDRETSIDMASVARWISALAGIPPSSVDLMAPQDMIACATAISSFLAPSEPASSSLPAISTSVLN